MKVKKDSFCLDGFNALDELNKTDYSSVDLLPQNNAALVHDSKMAFEILKTLHNIIHLLAESLTKFYINKQYQCFDPHVGESACQIRAYAFVMLSKKKPGNELMERICFLNLTLRKLKTVLGTTINLKKNSQTIIELAQNHECYFSVGWSECLLYGSYFLTIFKKVSAKGAYICKEKIAHFFTSSKRLSERMVDEYQSRLARMSCDFIKSISIQVGINEKNSPSIGVSILYDDAGRSAYPLFFFQRFFLCICTKRVVLY